MSVIDTLITDRTQADVDRVTELKEKYPNWTDEEKTEWFAGMRGAYNYTDLNRVGEAVAYVYELCAAAGIAVAGYAAPKTDWTVSDIPSQAQMNTYLNNITALRDATGSYQTIPATMDKLDFESANWIERLLWSADRIVAQMMTDWFYSGEFESGEL